MEVGTLSQSYLQCH